MGLRKSVDIGGDSCQVRVVHWDRVTRAKEEALSEKEVERVSSIYKVLSDPSRLRMVLALRRQEMCVCDLAALLGVSESAVSHQLRRLKDLFLVKKRREGQILYYALDDRHLGGLLEISLKHIGRETMGGQPKTEG